MTPVEAAFTSMLLLYGTLLLVIGTPEVIRHRQWKNQQKENQ